MLLFCPVGLGGNKNKNDKYVQTLIDPIPYNMEPDRRKFWFPHGNIKGDKNLDKVKGGYKEIGVFFDQAHEGHGGRGGMEWLARTLGVFACRRSSQAKFVLFELDVPPKY